MAHIHLALTTAGIELAPFIGSIPCYANIQNFTDIAQNTNSGTWAQGAYFMHIDNSQWKSLGIAEMCGTANNFMTGNSNGRSALIGAMATGEVYLIVTSASASFETFRTAIQKYFGINDGSRDSASYCGIFLNGNGSSQLWAKKTNGSIASIPGDGRKLCQIIVIYKQN